MFLLVKKLLYNLKSEGLNETLNKGIKFLGQKIGLLYSITVFYRKKLNTKTNLKLVKNLKYEFKIIKDIPTLLTFNKCPDKLFFLPLKEWFNKGSQLLVLSDDGMILSYTWIHQNSYYIDFVGKIELGKNEVWIGPFYTIPKFRNRGLYYAILQYSLEYLNKQKVNFIYSSSNIKNLASMKVFSNLNFDIIGIVLIKNKNYQIIDFSKEKTFKRKINAKN